MPQSYGHIYLHIVFSTKYRENLLTPKLHNEFARYIGPIVKEHRARVITEGGMPDHVHLLIDLGREVSISTILREIKSSPPRGFTEKAVRPLVGNQDTDILASV